MEGSVKYRLEYRETGRICKRTRKTRNDALNTVKTRLEKIEKTLGQLVLKKGEREKSKGESYVEAAIRGSKAAPAQNKNKNKKTALETA
jgi:hypothetical protein